MKNCIIEALLMFILAASISCSKDNFSNEEDDSTNHITEQLESVSSADIESSEEKINKSGKISISNSELQDFLSGVWSFQSKVERTRKLSWGTVPINNDYFIFDFYAKAPLFIHGYSEGGPSFDHLVGKIEDIKINGDSIIIYYRKVLSWRPFSLENETYYNIEDIEEAELESSIEELKIFIDISNDKIRFDAEMNLGYSTELNFIRLSEKI